MSPQKKMPRKKLQMLVPHEIYYKIAVIQAILKRIREEAQYD